MSDQLRQAAKAVVDRWDEAWGADLEPMTNLMRRLRLALDYSDASPIGGCGRILDKEGVFIGCEKSRAHRSEAA